MRALLLLVVLLLLLPSAGAVPAGSFRVITFLGASTTQHCNGSTCVDVGGECSQCDEVGGTLTITMRDAYLHHPSFHWALYPTQGAQTACAHGHARDALSLTVDPACAVLSVGPDLGLDGEIDVAWSG